MLKHLSKTVPSDVNQHLLNVYKMFLMLGATVKFQIIILIYIQKYKRKLPTSLELGMVSYSIEEEIQMEVQKGIVKVKYE